MFICAGTTPTIQVTMTFNRITRDEVNRASAVHRHASGKPVNVGRGLHTLGRDATVCIPVGGETGRSLRDEMNHAGIGNRCIEIAGLTRTCITAIDRTDGTATELVEEHASMSQSESDAMLSAIEDLLKSSKMLILSGSLAHGVGDEFYAKCCRMAQAAKVQVILDARGPAMLKALETHPLVVKPNRHELADTLKFSYSDDSALRKAMLDLHARGAQWVLITMGKNGAMLTDGKSFWKADALDVPAVSAIGSGDAFTAGLAAAIAAGQPVSDACKLAAACAAANTLIPGSGLFHRDDALRLEKLARVTKI